MWAGEPCPNQPTKLKEGEKKEEGKKAEGSGHGREVRQNRHRCVKYKCNATQPQHELPLFVTSVKVRQKGWCGKKVGKVQNRRGGRCVW